MAKNLLIVHGYSDGSTSFTGLGDEKSRDPAFDPKQPLGPDEPKLVAR